MNGKPILLDTNAYSNLLRGNEEVFQFIRESLKINFSVFVLAELLTGFLGGSKEKKNKSLLDEFIENKKVAIVSANYQTAIHFAEIKQDLKVKGTPIPINDIWIAAHAIQTNSLLITQHKHFLNIDKLEVGFF